MDVVIDWEQIPWDEPEDEAWPGYREKSCACGDRKLWLCEFSEGYARGWCEEGHLAHVLSGESTLRIRDLQRSVRLRAGDTAIIPAGEAHRMEPAAGESIQILLFEQVC